MIRAGKLECTRLRATKIKIQTSQLFLLTCRAQLCLINSIVRAVFRVELTLGSRPRRSWYLGMREVLASGGSVCVRDVRMAHLAAQLAPGMPRRHFKLCLSKIDLIHSSLIRSLRGCCCLGALDGCSLRGLDLLGGLHAVSVAILFLSGDVTEVSHSAGASGVSSLGLDRPVISSLLGVEAATRLGVLSLLLVEVGSSGESTDAVRVHVLLTSCWSSSLVTYNTVSPEMP